MWREGISTRMSRSCLAGVSFKEEMMREGEEHMRDTQRRQLVLQIVIEYHSIDGCSPK